MWPFTKSQPPVVNPEPSKLELAMERLCETEFPDCDATMYHLMGGRFGNETLRLVDYDGYVLAELRQDTTGTIFRIKAYVYEV